MEMEMKFTKTLTIATRFDVDRGHRKEIDRDAKLYAVLKETELVSVASVRKRPGKGSFTFVDVVFETIKTVK